jgi:hypothetical protein
MTAIHQAAYPPYAAQLRDGKNQSASVPSFLRLQHLMVRRGELIERRAELIRGHQSAGAVEKKLIDITAEIMEEEMRLEEWDRRIAPKLQDLEYCGNTIARHARHIEATIKNLDARPAWETKARDSLNQAEIELRIALAVVQMAQWRYDALQIISEAAE